MLDSLAGWLATVTGKAVLGATVAASSVGLHASNVVDIRFYRRPAQSARPQRMTPGQEA